MNICCSCERTVKESYDYLIEKHNTYLQYIPLPFELRYEIGKYLNPRRFEMGHFKS
jgi:hypothetical protein